MGTTARSLRHRLTLYAAAFTYSLAAIAGILLTIQDSSQTSDKIMSAIGLNVIASVIFGLVFATLSARVQERALQDNIDDQLVELGDRLIRQIAETNHTYFPSVQYPATGDFDEIFNRDITLNLSRTSDYYFRGPSPRYLPARIKTAKRHPAHVNVAMLDPRSRRALTRRAADRRLRKAHRYKTVDQIVAELQNELLMSVVALFDCRQLCPIKIIYTLDTAVTRAELFDDSIFISWYHGPSSPGSVFPETLRFSANSVIYETLKLDMIRQHEIFQGGASFTPEQTDEDLIEHLKTLSSSRITSLELSQWRAEYKDFTNDFMALLQRITTM